MLAAGPLMTVDLSALPTSDKKMMLDLAMFAGTLMKKRVVMQGKGVTKKLKKYSTKPIHMPMAGRVKPKGGKLSKGKKTMFFPGGYSEFKGKYSGSTKVNYTLTGTTMGGMHVLSHNHHKSVVGFVSGEPREIAEYLQKRSLFFGLNSKEGAKIALRARSHLYRILSARNTKGGSGGSRGKSGFGGFGLSKFGLGRMTPSFSSGMRGMAPSMSFGRSSVRGMAFGVRGGGRNMRSQTRGRQK